MGLAPKGISLKPEGLSLKPDSEEVGARTVLDLTASVKYTPRAMLLFARRGEGKSLLMTTLLRLLSEWARRVGASRPVATNYRCTFSDFQSPLLLDQLQEFPNWAWDLLIGIDEIADAVPSTRANSTYSLLTAGFMRQIRKRRSEVIAATQFPQEIGRAMLRQIDWFVECEKIDQARGVRMYWHDWWGQWTGRTYRKYWPPEKHQADFVSTVWGTDAMFGTYYTDEIFAPVVSDMREDIIRDQWDGGWSADPAAALGMHDKKVTLKEILDQIRGATVTIVEDLMELAREDLQMPYLTEKHLKQMLIGWGFDVAPDGTVSRDME